MTQMIIIEYHMFLWTVSVIVPLQLVIFNLFQLALPKNNLLWFNLTSYFHVIDFALQQQYFVSSAFVEGCCSVLLNSFLK